MRDDLDALAQRLGELPQNHCTFGYIRISSAKQQEGVSIEAQEKLIRKYCSQQGLGEPFIVTEVSSAGKRMFRLPNLGGTESEEETESRHRLLLLLGHISAVKKSHLVVWRLDRIARFNDEREILYQMLCRYDSKLHSTDATEQTVIEKGDPNDPMTALMRQVFGAFSQYEKAIIEMRMETGMRYKAAQGGYTGGRPPYGYDAVNGELVINQDQAKRVRYIFMAHKKYAYTLRHIEQVMGKTMPEGEKMGRTKIHRIIQNETLYRGVYIDRYCEKHQRPDLNILGEDPENYDYEEEFKR